MNTHRLPASRFPPTLATAVFVIMGAVTAASGQTYSWTNFAGAPGGQGNADGTGTYARFYFMVPPA